MTDADLPFDVAALHAGQVVADIVYHPRDTALLRAFDASGKTLNEFADMYGLHVLDANRTLERARARIKPQA